MTGTSIKSRSLELTPVRRLIDDVPDLVRQHGRRLLPGLYIPVLAFGFLPLIFQQWHLQWIGDGASSVSLDFAAVGVFFVLSVGLLLFYAGAFNATLVAATGAVMGRGAHMGQAWRFVIRPVNFLVVIGVSLLGLFSLTMCLLPALYVVPRFAFVLPAMADEELSPLAASRRSRELIHFTPGGLLQSGWILTLLVQTVGALVTYVITFIVQLPFSIIQIFLFMRDVGPGAAVSPDAMVAPLWLQIPTVLLSSLGTSLAWLYWCFATAALFLELRRRKEGDDLQEAIDELTGMGITSHELHEETPPI